MMLFFVMGSSAQQECEALGGQWNVDHCIVTLKMLDSGNTICDPGTMLDDNYCKKGDLTLKFVGSEYPSVEQLLNQNNISFHQSNLVVTSGPVFAGDPGCGAVIDDNSDIYWFDVDSRSNAKNMTVYSENPNPCKVNWSSCFCNAQTKLTELTTAELSYLTKEEEEEVGKSVQRRFENIPHQIPVTKFVVGKYNLDLGEKYDEICGILLTRGDREEKFNEEYSVYKYFSAAKEGMRLWDFSLSIGSENLCAVLDDATIFEYEKSD